MVISVIFFLKVYILLKFFDIRIEVTNIKVSFNQLTKSDLISNSVKKINDLKTELDLLNVEIAKGATTEIKDCIKLGISGGVAMINVEMLPGVILGTITKKIVGEGGNVLEYNKMMQENFDKQVNLVNEIRIAFIESEMLNVEYGLLSSIYTSTQRLDSNLSQKNKNAENLINLLIRWRVNLESLTNKIGTDIPPGFFTTQIQDGIDYWNNVKNICTKNSDILSNSIYNSSSLHKV